MADSHQVFRHPLWALVLAVGVAGAMDSFAFLQYGAFVANQSGNVVLVGIGLAGKHPTWPGVAASLAAFAVGAGVTSRWRGATRRRSATLVTIVVTELTMLLWAGLNLLLAYGQRAPVARVALAGTGAFAMGCLTTLFNRTAGVTTTIVYQSGTVEKTGEHAVGWIMDRGDQRSRARIGALLGLLALGSYAAGGAIGTLAQQQPRWVPLWGALVPPALLLLRRRGDHQR